MSQLRIFTEIITLTAPYLACEKNALHSLLTVNKLCFITAVPILYKNPFHPRFWGLTSKVNKREVLYLLLASSNLLLELENPMTELSEWDLTESDLPTAPFTVNYLDYYTEINYFEWARISDENYCYVTTNFNLEVDQIVNFLFCKYNAKKLKSMYLPILDMKLYLPLATRMSSLKRLEYDRIENDDAFATYDQGIVTIQDAIEFVKIHVETFGDALTEIKIPDLSDLKCDRNQLDIQIGEIINLLKRPSVIEVDGTYDFCKYIQEPTVEHLRVFRGPLMRYRAETPNWDSASLFQRCPKLEKVRFCPSGPNSFKWAVEKRALLLDAGPSFNRTSGIKLPPLRDVCVICKNFASLRFVEDIIYAFRNTIRNIIVVEETHITEHSPQPVNWNWMLPNLVKIQIQFVDFTLFDLESLNVCPSLEELNLNGFSEYCSSRPEFRSVLRLPNLRSITLLNRISLQFNLDSLKYSPLLETIMLSEKDASLSMPSSDSPIWTWTWNWKLPRLKKLSLIGESAALFQFHLLDSCPRLEHLYLYIGEYYRTFTLKDIQKTDLSTECVSQIVPRNEVSHKCKEVYFREFEISGKTLSTLLQRYMSQVTEIHLIEVDGLTSADIIKATQKLPHVRYVHSSLTLTVADIRKNGMYQVESKKYGEVWRCGSVNYIMRHSLNQVRTKVIKSGSWYI